MSAVAPAAPATHAALVALTTLAGLPSISPWRLRRLLWHHRPTEAYDLLRSGAELHPMVHRALSADALRALRDEARQAVPGQVLERCARTGVDVVPLGDARYPPVLAVDAEAPVVLFVRGDPDVCAARRVAVVGTRNATCAGRATAAELGQHLAEHGVTVVSGLARGIDGSAHRGVRAARSGPSTGRPAGVVANGLDRPYPRQHTELWHWVAEAGVLLSEWPPGSAPAPWRFPLRNRIIAALAEVAVVVESRDRGGSLITARAAADRGVPVMAVPGSPRIRAASGVNGLIRDGAHPVTTLDDVLSLLGLAGAGQGRLPFDTRRPPDEFGQRVLAHCSSEPATLDMLVAALGCTVTEAALAATRLVHDRWLVEAGGWFEPAGSLVGRL